MKVSALALVAAGLVGGTSASAAPPRWHVVRGASAHSAAVVWSAGRLWFLNATSSGGFTVRSGRVANGRLSDWKTAAPKLDRADWIYLEGSARDLVFTTSERGPDVPLVAVRLMPNGTLGDPVDIGGAPAPQSSTGAGFAQLPDRAIRVTGIPSSRVQFASHLGVCCDVDGKVVSFQRYPGTSYSLGRLGVDRKGRLWLAWVPGRQGVKQQVRIAELDPGTLKVRGAPKVVPGFRGFVNLRAVVCTDTCRVIVEGYVGRSMKAVSWAPGDARTTTVRIPQRTKCVSSYCGEIIDAREDRGRLVIAYAGDASQAGYTIGIARGGVRGDRLRRVSSVRQPAAIGPFRRGLQLSSRPFGALGPDGFAAIAVYTGSRSAVVRVAFLPLR